MMKNSLEDFYEQASALADRAAEFGIESVFILMECDHLADNSSLRMVRKGHYYAALGAVEAAKQIILEEIAE